MFNRFTITLLKTNQLTIINAHTQTLPGDSGQSAMLKPYKQVVRIVWCLSQLMYFFSSLESLIQYIVAHHPLDVVAAVVFFFQARYIFCKYGKIPDDLSRISV